MSSACSTTLERWRTSHEVLGMRSLVSWGYNPTCRTTEKRSIHRTFCRRVASVDCADQHSTSMTGRALDTLFRRSVQDHKCHQRKAAEISEQVKAVGVREGDDRVPKQVP